MDDLISRQAAIGALGKAAMSYSSLFSDWMMTYQKALKDGVDAIEELPPAQSQRMHGRWQSGDGAGAYCSECERYTPFPYRTYTFCPHCGADMREETEHEQTQG